MTLAERLLRLACSLLAPRLRDWGEAMAQEAASIRSPGAALAFALGCSGWILGHALAHALRSAVSPPDIDPAQTQPRQDRWASRDVALACAVAAASLGLLFLSAAGAPGRYVILNLTALIAGLIIVLPFRRKDPVEAPFIGVVSITVGLALLLTAALGDAAEGARRWVSLGDVVLQPGLIGLPFLLVAFAGSRDILTTTGLVLGAIALGLQPDPAMASALLAAAAVATLMKPDRPAWVLLAVALACFILTELRSGEVAATPFVNDVFRTASLSSPIAALAVWSGTVLLLLPAILGLCRRRQARAAHATFGATWLALVAAAIFGTEPVPLIAYGGSAIVGYLLSTLALPGKTAPSRRPASATSPQTTKTFTPRNDCVDRFAKPAALQASLLRSLPVAFAFALVACGQVTEPEGATAEVTLPSANTGLSSARTEVPKVEQVGVWQPGPDGEQVPLWPTAVALAKPDSGDRPEATGNGSPTVGGRKWHWATYVTRPTMTIYRPRSQNTGAAMLVLPGGGFYAVAMDLEGTEICDWVVQQGMTCAVLKYRTPQVWPQENGRQRRPEVLLGLEDAQRAMSLLRQRASTYGIDPQKIGVIGFSAGAYLVANMSNTVERTYPRTDAADEQSSRPDFAIVAYTARMLDNSKGRNNLQLQPWVQVSAQAPPTLIIHAMDDPVDDIRQPMAYALALNDAGVPVDLRVYAEGGHAFGMRPTTDHITTDWPDQVRDWLLSLGML
ncbi:alpha/beta hydrolase [Brevundimonas variabilis]|uniref:Acetyl esterase/lipase n=1 Tax=Brevundimonas variabilis TaxID=74312 RepID=A0A7W9CGK4_9CAUL|nr:alpha/beta hydrolase [Brevundimonas variabilis]MBB5745174.1 acetyl esterase/lipase [Brevundimonas variabilis]